MQGLFWVGGESGGVGNKARGGHSCWPGGMGKEWSSDAAVRLTQDESMNDPGFCIEQSGLEQQHLQPTGGAGSITENPLKKDPRKETRFLTALLRLLRHLIAGKASK